MGPLLQGRQPVLAYMSSTWWLRHNVPNAFMASPPGHPFWQVGVASALSRQVSEVRDSSWRLRCDLPNAFLASLPAHSIPQATHQTREDKTSSAKTMQVAHKDQKAARGCLATYTPPPASALRDPAHSTSPHALVASPLEQRFWQVSQQTGGDCAETDKEWHMKMWRNIPNALMASPLGYPFWQLRCVAPKRACSEKVCTI